MKDPKALFPFLFATSWLGNLLLTFLAFFLAFTSEGPLTPLLFLTVALCILSGNALPISVYLILVRWRAAELRAESAQASGQVRAALARSEEVLDRLDEAEGSLGKAILIARQVPDRIRESMESLEAIAARLDTLQLDNFTQALAGQRESVDAVHGQLTGLKSALEELQGGFKDVRKELKGVPGSVEKLVAQLAESRPGQAADELDVSVGERLDLMFESLESVQDSLDSLLQRVVELKIAATPPPFPAATPPPMPVELPEAPPEPVAFTDEDDLEEVIEEDLPVEAAGEDDLDAAFAQDDLEEGVGEDVVVEASTAADLDPEPVDEAVGVPDEEQPEAAAAPPIPARPAARKRARKDTAQAEMPLGVAPADSGVPPAPSDGRTRLVVHAMIGMYNKLFIRGDEPWLSWDDGRQMELIGIGEFAYDFGDLREPIEVAVLINDETAAEGAPVRIEPGKTQHITPRFPRA